MLEDVLTNKVLKQVQVVFTRAAGGKAATYFTYTFRNVAISSYQLEDDSTGASVQITFAYQSIAINYAQGTTPGSPPPAGWNVVTNRGS
jgi:type VI protein secretion system component Hcp